MRSHRVPSTLAIILTIYFAHIPLQAVASGADLSSLSATRAAMDSLLTTGAHLRASHTDQSIDSALDCFYAARSLAGTEFGLQDSTLAAVLREMALCFHEQGRHDKCDSLLPAADQILEAAYGPQCPLIGRNLITLGACLRARQLYTQAEVALRRAVDILQQPDPPHFEWLGVAQDNLGLLCQILDRYDEAETLYQESLASWKRAGCDECVGEAKAQLQLGVIAMVRGEYAEAERRYRSSMEMFTKLFGPDDRMVVHSRGSIAEACALQGRFNEAESLAHAAVEASERIHQSDPGALVTYLMMLGDIQYTTGQFDKARANYRAAMQWSESTYGAKHPMTATVARSIAVIEHALGHDSASAEYSTRSTECKLRFLEGILPYASEDLRLWYTNGYAPIDETLLNIALAQQGESANSQALEMVLRGKGLVLDAASIQRTTTTCSEDEELASLDRHYCDIRTRIANLTLASAQGSVGADLSERLETLYREKGATEAELGRLCAQFQEERAQTEFSVQDVAVALHANSALLEFDVYQPLALPSADRAQPTENRARFQFPTVPHQDYVQLASIGRPRYLAFCLTPDGHVTRADIGESAVIDSLVDLYLDSVREYPGRHYVGGDRRAVDELSGISSMLYSILITPFQDLLATHEHVLISPDGELNCLPFEILRDADDEYLIESNEISYLSSGRDLLRYQSETISEAEYAVVIADPDFNSASTAHAFPSLLAVRGANDSVSTRGPKNIHDCLAEPFFALPATRTEGDAVVDMLQSEAGLTVDYYTRADAAEDVVKNLDAPPKVLHLATHGFWCPGARSTTPSSSEDNPLLYSGFALAGANEHLFAAQQEQLPVSGQEDGLLTSYEISGIDLVGTELAVLSACQTGIGEIRNGEGVFGLRRAFLHAGARTIIMSMFEVPDETAASFVLEFYRLWLAGESKASAVRHATLKLLKTRRDRYGSAHPMYWAGFCLIGDPR